MSLIGALLEFMGKLQENPNFFFLLKSFSILSVSYRIFVQFNKIILFVRVNKVFLIDPFIITYGSWKGLFKDYLILHFKIMSFSSLVVWFFDNPFRLAHMILLFSLLLSGFLLLFFFLFSKKELNFIEGIKLFFFFLFFLGFLILGFLYNFNVFIFVCYGVWLDLVIRLAYVRYDMGNMSLINKIRVIYTQFLSHVELTSKTDLKIHKNHRSLKPKK